MPSIEDRVIDGAAWLDEVEPGWAERIDLIELNLQDACRCVLGQLVKQYDRSATYYDVAFDEDYAPCDITAPYFLTTREACEKGFHCYDGEEDNRAFQQLTGVWKTHIEKRLAEAGKLA